MRAYVCNSACRWMGTFSSSLTKKIIRRNYNVVVLSWKKEESKEEKKRDEEREKKEKEERKRGKKVGENPRQMIDIFFSRVFAFGRRRSLTNEQLIADSSSILKKGHHFKRSSSKRDEKFRIVS